jgi:hypothetical protein
MEQWILRLLPYVLSAIGMALCLYLFCSLKAEIRRLQKGAAAERERLEQAIRQLTIPPPPLPPEPAPAPAPACPPRTPGVDLTIRTQALRMDRRGESPATIAAALSVPRNQIDLMLKVNRLVSGPSL